MRRILLVLLSASFLFSCDRTELSREYYSDGRLKSEAEVKNGLKNGLMSTYFPNGTIKSKQLYKNDTLNGTGTFFNIEGKIDSIITYERGKLNGEYQKFYPNGNIAGRGNFVNGKNHGLYYQYDPVDSGRVLREAYLIPVRGSILHYYVKKINPAGEGVDEYRSIGIHLPSVVKLKDTVNVEFNVLDMNAQDSVLVVVGEFDDEFNLRSRADTISIKKGSATYRFVVKKSGMQLLRGEVINYTTKVYRDSSVTYTAYGYFEEKVIAN
ncbi:MAG TPA: hypothetical protein VIU12_18060 [Chryseolinea sp.]